MDSPLVFLLCAVGILVPFWGESYLQGRRRRDWYAQFASVDELRLLLTDEAGLRRIRDERGTAVAFLVVRREFPRCPFPEALKLIQSL